MAATEAKPNVTPGVSSMRTPGVMDGFDGICSHILELYSTLHFKPPPGQFTILASFVLSNKDNIKVISLATGSKCLPTVRLSERGDAVHDSHAEILARRAAIRWFLEEASRSQSHSCGSNWIIRQSDGRYGLQDTVQLSMYISTPPCGDASMRFLASFQDPEMAALKNAAVFPDLPPNTASRGRDNYSLYGVLRTKPGRADSPPTLSMSCSDKMASWNVTGLQGALASKILKPIYLSAVVIGEVDASLQQTVREDCERALWSRLHGITGLPPDYHVNQPEIHFTSIPFQHSRISLGSSNSCNESICWQADAVQPHDVLINGMKRGVSPKHRHNPKFRPLASKISIFELYRKTISLGLAQLPVPDTLTYFDCKQSIEDYQAAKKALIGEAGPFCGWIKSGKRWESFVVYGSIIHE